MLVTILEFSIYLALFYTLYFFLFRKEVAHQYNRMFLLASIPISGLLVMMPRWDIGSLSSELLNITLPTIWVGSGREMASAMTPENYNVSGILFGTILIIGLCVMFVRMIMTLRRIYQIHSHSKIYSIDDADVCLHPYEIEPFSFLGHIYISEEHKYDTHELRTIIKHEGEHIRRKHSYDNIYLELMSGLLWWNPFYYLIKRDVKVIHEFQADQKVVESGELMSYANFLIGQLSCVRAPQLTNPLFSHPIKLRIKMMKNLKSNKMSKLKYVMIAPFLVMMLLFHSCAEDAVVSDSVENKFVVEKGSESEESTFEIVDTVLTFDPETKEEDMKIVKSKEEYFRVVEDMPRFPGCEEDGLSGEDLRKCSNQKMLQFIYKNIKYPKAAQENDVEGTVVAQFIVRKDGRVIQPKLVRELGHGTSEEVLRVLNKMNSDNIQWTPGVQGGKKVNVMFTLPVKFKLQ